MEKIFNPQNIAVIGASGKENSVGRGIMENLTQGEKSVFLVNPFEDTVLGKETYEKVTDIKEDIDLAVIAVPKNSVPEVIEDCIKGGVGGVIIISAGFAESGKEGREKQEEIKERLDSAQIPLVGPNCLGIIRPSFNLNASFAPGTPKEGEIALISQSGALIDSIIDRSFAENYGFSVLVSVGNAAGLNIGDYLKWADEDKETKVIAVYMEGISDGREFFEALKRVKKPVLVLKGGRTEKAKKSVVSHTGSLAGETKIFSSAIKQAGAIEVFSVEELFDACKALAWQPVFEGGVGVVTNGGGAGVLFVDALELDLPELNEDTVAFLEEYMHPDYSKANPLDIVGDALPDRYQKAIEGVLKQDDISALAVIQTLQTMTEPIENAKIIMELQKKFKKPVVTIFMGGGKETKEAIDFLESNKVPNYSDPKRGANALKILHKSKSL